MTQLTLADTYAYLIIERNDIDIILNLIYILPEIIVRTWCSVLCEKY